MKLIIKYIYVFIFLIMIIFSSNMSKTYAARGCCSWHGGVSGCGSNGKIICNDGTYSPSCTCTPTYNYYGCTNKNAINYDSKANIDDGSCIIKVEGCTDSNAINYDDKANISDGSCLYAYIETEEIIIPFNTQEIEGPKNEIKQNGKTGKKELTKKIIKDENGNIISSEITNTKIIEKAIDEIVIVTNELDSITIKNEKAKTNNTKSIIIIIAITLLYIIYKKVKKET